MKTHDEIRRLLREFERSGLTQRQFAAQSGVAYSTQELTLLLDGVQWAPAHQRNWHRQ